MDQGVNINFDSTGFDDPTYGAPVLAEGPKGLIITGSSTRANNDQTKGGRLILHVKCVNDPAGVDTGKEGTIGLNYWHTDDNSKRKAHEELAAITRAITGNDARVGNTMELYNRPFIADSSHFTPAPSPQNPTPRPFQQWRNYRTVAAGFGPASGGAAQQPQQQMPNFNQNGNQQQQPQNQNNGFNQQPQQQNNNNNGGWQQPNNNGGNNNQGGWG